MNKNNELEVFLHEDFGKVRTHIDKQNIQFVAKDMCNCLEIINNRSAISDLDDDEKGVLITSTLSGKQKMNTVSESGLYALIFKFCKIK